MPVYSYTHTLNCNTGMDNVCRILYVNSKLLHVIIYCHHVVVIIMSSLTPTHHGSSMSSSYAYSYCCDADSSKQLENEKLKSKGHLASAITKI